jgi:hypothetical protein
MSKSINDLSCDQNYLIGQRVIYDNTICTVVNPPKLEKQDKTKVWIANPARGYHHWVSAGNVRALPNGQL